MRSEAGACGLSSRSADAALSRVLAPGAYTLHIVSTLPDATGIALAECYDASGVSAVDGPHLANVSARATVGAAERTLIGGFVVAGEGTVRLLLRGVGPALAGQGVSTPLADPELRVFRDGAEIATNDNWENTAAMVDTFRRVGAFSLEANSSDAALIVDLPAGVYTAHVSNHGGNAGTGMVEIYEVL